MYDLGALTRDLQVTYLVRHRPIARNLSPLVSSLRHLTDTVAGEQARQGAESAPREWIDALSRWRERLGAYEAALASVRPSELDGIVWTVAAPLLLGLFGGPEGDPPREPDCLVPFVLANALDVEKKFEQEAWSRFKADKTGGLGLLRKFVQAAVSR